MLLACRGVCTCAHACPTPPLAHRQTAQELRAGGMTEDVNWCVGWQVSMTSACGNDKGGCEANIFLDPDSASTVDGFYVGSIIEISPDSPSAAAGQVLARAAGEQLQVVLS